MRFCAAICIACCLLSAQLCCAADASDIRLLVRESTGELEFFNSSEAVIAIAGYALESDTGGFLFNQWMPITGRLDANGDGSFDPSGEWIVLSPDDSETDLSEGVVTGMGGALAPNEWVSIGFALDIGTPHGLEASIVVDDGMSSMVLPIDVVITPTGDYDFDGDVDTDDYAVYRETFGSTADLRADGNEDGVVSAIDYAVWREALALAVAPTQTAPMGLMAIPEPASFSLASIGALCLPRRRRPRSDCPLA